MERGNKGWIGYIENYKLGTDINAYIERLEQLMLVNAVEECKKNGYIDYIYGTRSLCNIKGFKGA